MGEGCQRPDHRRILLTESDASKHRQLTVVKQAAALTAEKVYGYFLQENQAENTAFSANRAGYRAY